jgi:iron complex outermembrane recepter protein
MRNYTSILLVSLSLLIFKTANAQENTIIEISGFVTDQEKNQPLAGVTVSIKGTVSGTTTSNEGQFTLRTKQKLPFTLVFSSIGFKAQEVQITSLGSKLQVALATQTVLGNEVVVTYSSITGCY